MYNAAVWLYRVKDVCGDRVDITWKHFQLEQANNSDDSGWKVWDQCSDYKPRSLLAAKAGEAARRQGLEVFNRFHLALLEARHGGARRITLNNEEHITQIAKVEQLNVPRFIDDLRDPTLLKRISSDHMRAVEDYGVFGTPTFVFENGNAVYMKSFVPPKEDSMEFFEHFIALMANRSYLGELKRPQPPWPKGAI